MSYKLICFDMDGVLFPQYCFWIELHKVFGTYEEGKKLTEELVDSDYDKLVEEVVGRLWKGKDAKAYYDLVDSIPYLKGVKEVFEFVKEKQLISGIISGSSLDVTKRVQKDFDVDHIFANELIIKDEKVSGEYIGTVRNGRHNKALVLNKLCSKLGISPKECIYVGDADIDIEIFQEVGFSIAFNSDSKELKEIASIVVEGDNLLDVLVELKKLF